MLATTVGLLALSTALAHAAAAPRLMGALPTSQPPVLDGRLDEPCWQQAEVAGDFTKLHGDQGPASKPTEVRICYDEQYLYLGALLHEPQVGSLVAEAAERDDPVWEDDALEVFLDVAYDHRSYFQFGVNSAGVLWDGKRTVTGELQTAWNSAAQAAVHLGADYWSVELAIPLTDLNPELLGYQRPVDAGGREHTLDLSRGQVVGVNFRRFDMVSQPPEVSTWKPGGAHEPSAWGHLVFGLATAGLEEAERARYTAPPVVSANLVKNGSFELTLPGLDPRYPDFWIQERWSRDDRLEVVTDPARARDGRRAVRIHAPQDRGLRLHTTVMLQPGQSYVLSAWARREAAAAGATLTLLPGTEVFWLTAEWQQYTVNYTHPSDMPGEMGLIVEVGGGPALVDQVVMLPAGSTPQVPAELTADRTTLTVLPAQPQWRQRPDEPVWQERIPLLVAEVMDQAATQAPVSFQIRDLFPGFTYNYLAQEKLRLVDAASGEPVPFALVEGDNVAGLSPRDVITFPADCPPRTQKLYYLYLADREPTPVPAQPRAEAPDFAAPETEPYTWALDTDRLPVQRRVAVSGTLPDLSLRHYTAQEAAAELISPEGAERLALPLEPQAGEVGLWRPAPGFTMPTAAPGVWTLRATFGEAEGATETVEVGVVPHAALWAGNTVRRILREDPPQAEAAEARLSGARNETVAFQVVLDANIPLAEVDLRLESLRHTASGAVLPAEAVRLDRIEELYLASPSVGPDAYHGGYGHVPYTGRAGYYPDLLLPWRRTDLAPGERRLAWVSMDIPEQAAAGEYEGAVTATAAQGTTLTLPVRLQVFDFTLPDTRSFMLLIGADLRMPMGRSADRWYGGNRELYTTNVGAAPFHSDAEAAFRLAEFLLRRGVTPFYYYQDGGFYPIPWRYDPQGPATFDFSLFDRNLERLGALRPRYFIFTSEWRTGWGSIGWIRDGSLHGMGSQYSATNDQPLGQAMRRAWTAGVRAHMEERGMVEAAAVYTTDEPHGIVEQVTAEISELIKQEWPQMKTFAAGYGRGAWREYFEHTDLFAGAFDEENRERFRAQGGVDWGPYNRPAWLAAPLATARIVGLDCWLRGYPAYFLYSGHTQEQDPMVNPQPYTYLSLGKSASDPTPRSEALGGIWPRLTYIGGIGVPDGLDRLVYTWPEDEPLPEGATRAFASSMRLEAMVESANDYEYLRILSELAEKAGPESAPRQDFDRLVAEARALVQAAGLGGGTVHNVEELQIYEMDPERFTAWRQRVGQAIEQATRRAGQALGE